MNTIWVFILLTLISNISASPGDIARQKCKQYSKLVYRSIERIQFPWQTYNYQRIDRISTCGLNIMPGIYGGTKAYRNEFPHMAAIGFGQRIDELSYKCGGTLLSEQFVVTASHCTRVRGEGPAYAVRLGSINLLDKDDHTRIIQVKEIHPHPDYESASKYNDIGLLRLKRSVYFNEYIRPACLNTNLNILWDTAIACGFGHIESGEQSNELLKVELSRTKESVCKESFLHYRKMKRGVLESQFCAGHLAGGKDTCQGDSGGPLQILLDDPYCMYHIIGITSFGKGCGLKNAPAIYTNVASYIDWIESIVWNSSNHVQEQLKTTS